MPLYTWRCREAHRFDALAGRGSSSSPCPQCGQPATRETVYRIAATGFAQAPPWERDLRQDYRLFNEASAELEYKHSRLENAAGKPLLPPPLYRAAKAKAQKLMRQGAKSSADVPELNRK